MGYFVNTSKRDYVELEIPMSEIGMLFENLTLRLGNVGSCPDKVKIYAGPDERSKHDSVRFKVYPKTDKECVIVAPTSDLNVAMFLDERSAENFKSYSDNLKNVIQDFYFKNATEIQKCCNETETENDAVLKEIVKNYKYNHAKRNKNKITKVFMSEKKKNR